MNAAQPPAPRPWSLRRRLLAVALAAGALAWLAGGLAIYVVVQSQHAALFDERLGDIAKTLLAFADHEIAEVEAEGGQVPVHLDTEGTARGRYRYQIWSLSGRLVLSSPNAPSDRPFVPLASTGFATVELGGETLRVIVADAPSRMHVIQAAEPVGQRLDMGDVFNSPLLAGLALSVVAIVGWTLLLSRLALRPVDATAAQIGDRGPTDLRPVAPERLPGEFTPLIDALNQLLRRLDVALKSERNFVAAAAHELRTPLAGLQAQSQLAAHPRTSEADRAAALRALQEGVDQSAHLVAQLLDLARSDALAGDPARMLADAESVALRATLEEALADVAPAAAERGLRITQRLAVPTLVGSSFALRVVLRNLLSNAVGQAPDGSDIEVGSRPEGEATLLWVADRGPGIAPADSERLFERFHRGRGNTRPGVGLGLAIVKALADAHGATVALRPREGGGLVVELRFPPRSLPPLR
ncbi:MAG: sensor histidine kinase N-terminal domain-containing protein [Rubrivivax sp.]|nr:sensor histidine kinase N-terminal domain-containing protein [Rubrivivax sp.]